MSLVARAAIRRQIEPAQPAGVRGGMKFLVQREEAEGCPGTIGGGICQRADHALAHGGIG